jgi:hypothetical protein
MIDPSFEMLTPTKNKLGDYKICKYNDVVVRPIPTNKTRIKDLKSIRYSFQTCNATPYFSNCSSQHVQEDYYQNQIKVPGKNQNYLYNYLVITRISSNPSLISCTENWVDGVYKNIKKADTIYTSEIKKFKLAVDVSAAWDAVKAKLEAR